MNIYITHVAIRYKGKIYSLPAPNRHHDVIRKIAEETGDKYIDALGDDQGFLDNTGRYLRRTPALNIAVKANQIKEGSEIIGNELYSENLW